MGQDASASPSAPARPAAPPSGAGRIWLLLGARAGDRAQVETLGAAVAAALGWSCSSKQIVANGFFRIPNLLLRGGLLSVDRTDSSPLAPPWPDLVIGAGRRVVPVARWIRRQSGGTTRLVHIGRPWAPLSWFDLIVTTPQYQLPRRANVQRNVLPLSPLDPERLTSAAAHWKPVFDRLQRPWVAVLVGGEARPYRLDRATARRLAADADALAHAYEGSVLVATSPRTPPVIADTLDTSLTAPHQVHRWRPGGNNPYPALLALADRFLVTGDSASMLAEACAAAAARDDHVHIFALPERPDLRLRVARAMRRLAQTSPGLRAVYDRLVELGLITSTRDMTLFHSALLERGLATPIDADDRELDEPAAPVDELERTVARVASLFATPAKGSLVSGGTA
jgi:mitochondrial fission protein ELM1